MANVVPQSPNRIGGNIFTILTNAEDAITAFAGGGQTSAYQLAAQMNRVTTVATAADSVKLPKISAQSNVPGCVGWFCVVHNLGANALQLFGYASDTVNGIATATGESVGPGEIALCFPSKYTNSTDVGDWSVVTVAADTGTFTTITVTGESTLHGLAAGTGAGAIATNSAFGVSALAANTTGARNTAIGDLALTVNTIGADNTAVGDSALKADTTGAKNTAVGSSALAANTTGIDSVAVGFQAALVNTTGAITAIGSRALDANTTGTGNTAVGTDSLGANTIGTNNTAIGANALLVNTTGVNNVAVGAGAGAAVTIGTGNTLIGTTAGDALTTGTNNTAVGIDALGAETTGVDNTAVGAGALGACTVGTNNVAVGRSTLDALTTSVRNTAVGVNALGACTIGDDNTAVGSHGTAASAPLGALTTGVKCTAVGPLAGNTITTGSNVMCLGYNAQASGATATNEINLGDTNIGSIRAQVTSITGYSDERDKADIETIDGQVALDFILALEPVGFSWDMRQWYEEAGKKKRDGSLKKDGRVPGFIAQHVLAAQKAHGVEWARIAGDDNPERLEVTQGHMIPFLVAAVKHLAANASAPSRKPHRA